ncbi:unnamed protein product [Arctogadus glacialis]
MLGRRGKTLFIPPDLPRPPPPPLPAPLKTTRCVDASEQKTLSWVSHVEEEEEVEEGLVEEKKEWVVLEEQRDLLSIGLRPEPNRKLADHQRPNSSSYDQAPGQELPWPQLICQQNRRPVGLSGAAHGPQQACVARCAVTASTATLSISLRALIFLCLRGAGL